MDYEALFHLYVEGEGFCTVELQKLVKYLVLYLLCKNFVVSVTSVSWEKPEHSLDNSVEHRALEGCPIMTFWSFIQKHLMCRP